MPSNPSICLGPDLRHLARWVGGGHRCDCGRRAHRRWRVSGRRRVAASAYRAAVAGWQRRSDLECRGRRADQCSGRGRGWAHLRGRPVCQHRRCRQEQARAPLRQWTAGCRLEPIAFCYGVGERVCAVDHRRKSTWPAASPASAGRRFVSCRSSPLPRARSIRPRPAADTFNGIRLLAADVQFLYFESTAVFGAPLVRAPLSGNGTIDAAHGRR